VSHDRAPRDARVGTGAAVAVVLALLAGVQIADRATPASVQPVVSLAAAAALLPVARAAGLSWADVGLGGTAVRRGLAYALPCVLVVLAGYLVLVALPWTRDLLLDERYRQGTGQALLLALVLVPLRTVVLEEVAFRGVLWALLRRARGPGWATAVSSAVFGLWHVPAALAFADARGYAGAGPAGTAGVVAATVVVTAAAGVLLCELRRRSGSLAPAVALHWAANGFGALAAAMAWAWSS
jgi:uncharacterized protein